MEERLSTNPSVADLYIDALRDLAETASHDYALQAAALTIQHLIATSSKGFSRQKNMILVTPATPADNPAQATPAGDAAPATTPGAAEATPQPAPGEDEQAAPAPKTNPDP